MKYMLLLVMVMIYGCGSRNEVEKVETPVMSVFPDKPVSSMSIKELSSSIQQLDKYDKEKLYLKEETNRYTPYKDREKLAEKEFSIKENFPTQLDLLTFNNQEVSKNISYIRSTLSERLQDLNSTLELIKKSKVITNNIRNDPNDILNKELYDSLSLKIKSMKACDEKLDKIKRDVTGGIYCWKSGETIITTIDKSKNLFVDEYDKLGEDKAKVLNDVYEMSLDAAMVLVSVKDQTFMITLVVLDHPKTEAGKRNLSIYKTIKNRISETEKRASELKNEVEIAKVQSNIKELSKLL